MKSRTGILYLNFLLFPHINKPKLHGIEQFGIIVIQNLVWTKVLSLVDSQSVKYH